MIVPMKKLTVLCVESERDATLEALRLLGALHLAPVNPPENEEVESARKQFEHVRRALDVLARKPGATPSGIAPRQVVESLWAVVQERRLLREELETVRHESQRIEPFGDFDPATVRALADRGVTVRLLETSLKQPLNAPAGCVLRLLGRTTNALCYAMVCRGESPRLDATEVRLPEMSLAAMRRRIAAIDERLASLDAEADKFAGDHAAVTGLVNVTEDEWRLAEARAGMGDTGQRIVYLRGYCPEADVERIRREAARHGWGLIVDDPATDDPVPTQLKTSWWARPIQALFDVIGILPGYHEVDISAAFLLFFSLFFAMLVGDAGYGLIFLGLSVAGRRFMPSVPRQAFALLTIMSVCTIVWGALTGVYFGVILNWSVLRMLRIDWLAKEDNVKLLCFIIGVTHLSLAHLWNIWRMRRSLQAIAQFGWLCTTWTMFFYACKMVLGFAFPSYMLAVLGVGVVCIVLFMTPVKSLKEEWFNHAMLPLNLVSNFVDVVSYIRLFAVGTATYAVASNFNGLLGGMFHTWYTGLFAALFLFVAHALNIALALMGVMVHGVRLNTLEFSGHVGLQWTGIPYQPFKKICPSTENNKVMQP
jgi:V/A-type H+-transporting ATPase subunit I